MNQRRKPNPKHHVLKLHPDYWEKVMDGRKRSEMRKLDRDYEVGDTVSFRMYPKPVWGGRKSKQFKITFILKSDKFPLGLKDGYGLICIKPKTP